MKKFYWILILLIIVPQLSAQILDRTIAIVTLHKTENISRSKFDKQLEIWTKQTRQEPDQDARKTILDATINDILITQAAEKAGIIASTQQVNEAINQQKLALGTPISDEDFQQFIASQSGLTWVEYKEQVKNRIIQEQYIIKKYGDQLQEEYEPNNTDIEETYELYRTEFSNPSMVRIEHLFWDTRDNNDASQQKAAQAVLTKIGNSASKFDEYLNKSLDDSSFEGGDLGYVIRDESTYKILGKSFLDTVFKMKKNEVSKVLKSSIGYHIVKIVDVRDAKLLKLDDPIFPGEKSTVRDRVKQILKGQNQQSKFLELVQKEVEALRKEAKIKIISNNY